MIKNKLFILGIFCAGIFITACTSTPEPEQKQDVITQPVVKQEPVKEKKKEPEEPPNVKFARKLQELLDQNDIQGAIAHFENIPAKLKNDVDLKNLLGALYYSDRQYDNAIATAREILAIDSDNIDALELISMCNRAKGDKASYKATTDQILEKDPFNPSVNIQRAEDYALTKKYKLARDSYKKALQGDPNNSDALFGYAQMSFYTDDVKTAEEVFQQILDKEPTNAAALAYMGKISYDAENYLRASKYITEALKYDSTNYDYWMDYGTYLRYQGKFSEAANAWEKAVKLDPTYFLAYAYLAGNYDDIGEWDKALENYHKVIETNPKYFYAYESAAILEFHAKNYAEAINMFNKAYSVSPSYSYALMIAICYYKQNDAFNAKKVLTAALKKEERDSTVYNLIRFYAEGYNRNAENSLLAKINKETNRNNLGKMLFYMGMYYELNKGEELAKEYYAKVTNMQAPMFFEYRIAEWGLEQ